MAPEVLAFGAISRFMACIFSTWFLAATGPHVTPSLFCDLEVAAGFFDGSTGL